MSSDLAARFTDPGMILAIVVAIAVFATFYTIAIPYFERGDLGKRMKAVSTEREQIRSRERAKMNAEGGKATLRTQNNRSVSSIAEKFNLKEALVDANTVNRLRAAGLRSENALNTFLVARFVLPFVFLVLGGFWIFGLGYLETRGLLEDLCRCRHRLLSGSTCPISMSPIAWASVRSRSNVSWPDALDLMLICSESGISIEASMRRSDELASNRLS